jgi:hypothetical protein
MYLTQKKKQEKKRYFGLNETLPTTEQSLSTDWGFQLTKCITKKQLEKAFNWTPIDARLTEGLIKKFGKSFGRCSIIIDYTISR